MLFYLVLAVSHEFSNSTPSSSARPTASSYGPLVAVGKWLGMAEAEIGTKVGILTSPPQDPLVQL